MASCSAYCEPETGIHRFVLYAKSPEHIGIDIGREHQITPAVGMCVAGRVRVIAAEAAVEAPIPEAVRVSGYVFPELVTVQLLDARSGSKGPASSR